MIRFIASLLLLIIIIIRQVIKLVRKYQADLEEFGQVNFESSMVTRKQE